MNRLADMIARVEAVQSWLENVTYQMNHMVSVTFHPEQGFINILTFASFSLELQAAVFESSGVGPWSRVGRMRDSD